MPVQLHPREAAEAVDQAAQQAGYDIVVHTYGTPLDSVAAAEPVFGAALVYALELGAIAGGVYLLRRMSGRSTDPYKSEGDALNRRDWDSFRDKLYGRKKSKFDRFFK